MLARRLALRGAREVKGADSLAKRQSGAREPNLLPRATSVEIVHVELWTPAAACVRAVKSKRRLGAVKLLVSYKR